MESFIFYRSFYESIKNLEPNTQAEIYNAIMEYALNGVTPTDLSGVANAIFILVKPQIDANNRRRENGQKGGRPKAETKPKQNLNKTKTKPNNNLNETKVKPNVNVNDNENYNENESKEKQEKEKCEEIFESGEGFGIEAIKSNIIPPKIEWVEQYVRERGNKIDAQTFYDFYSSKGWMVGKSKMKDWKACVRTWERNRNQPKSPYTQKSQYDFNALQKMIDGG